METGEKLAYKVIRLDIIENIQFCLNCKKPGIYFMDFIEHEYRILKK